MPGSWTSSTNVAAPVRSAGSSLRWTRSPNQRVVILSEAHGERLKPELEARGWTAHGLALLGRDGAEPPPEAPAPAEEVPYGQVRGLREEWLRSEDWALDEECDQYGECDLLMPFIAAGKPVFNVEYGLTRAQFCRAANARGFMSLRKDANAMGAWREACWIG